ncbi:uncharacterized protein LOC133924195 isoform X2 [Phragmites australis]|uniref:uncharacterized protein LOC133924195 isoform X2 n=1 Tax=Phragmites australis TaxID=29695 RepID=UPI002D78F55F|nr:uncharacterized protein LOC133924195 isoform X2 [Phragmites australis]
MYRMICVKVDTLLSEGIDCADLEESCLRTDYRDKPAIIDVDIGTAVKGVVDDIGLIIKTLEESIFPTAAEAEEEEEETAAAINLEAEADGICGEGSGGIDINEAVDLSELGFRVDEIWGSSTICRDRSRGGRRKLDDLETSGMQR